ncbi:MAG: MFS transporter [Sporomusaceae bacterium]|jgi:FSR family fosmidomycin resistance protein-like MFS transporter|nr:MFS transporter [Sporomusaceae bacterium]
MLSAKPAFVSRTLLVLALAHLVNDLSQGAIPVLLPIFKEEFALTYTQVGVIVFVMNFTSSIIQPVFGYFADKRDNLWVIPLGMFGAGVGLSLIGVMSDYYSLLGMVFFSGIGVAAFHPQAMKAANLISDPAARGRTMGVFSIGGNAGFAVGSLSAAYFYNLTGSFYSTLLYLVPTVITTVVLYYTIKNLASLAPPQAAKAAKGQVSAQAPTGKLAALDYKLISLLLLFIFNRSTIQTGLITYIPLYFVTYLGDEHVFASYVLSTFLFAGAFGTFVGAAMSDKFGRKAVIIGSMLAMLPLIFLLPHTSGAAAILVVALAGMTLPASMATTIVFAQEMMPHNVGMASALTTGFSIGMGGVGALLLGNVADHFGMMSVFTLLTILTAVGAGIAALLPSPQSA